MRIKTKGGSLKVHELIAALQKCPADSEVCIGFMGEQDGPYHYVQEIWPAVDKGESTILDVWRSKNARGNSSKSVQGATE